MVAFLQKLPRLTPAQYQALVEQAPAGSTTTMALWNPRARKAAHEHAHNEGDGHDATEAAHAHPRDHTH